MFTALCSITAMAQVPNYVPANGLVGWWPFTGNANDQSVNGLNGNVVGAALTTDRNGTTNASYDFTFANAGWGSQNNEIYIPYNSLLNVNFITVSLWLYPRSYYWTGDAGNPNSTILNRFQYTYSNPSGGAWGISFNQTSVEGSIVGPTGTGGASAISNVPLQLNVWQNIVMTYDGAQIKLYIDGILAATQTHTAAMNIAGNSGISIGESNQANGYWTYTDGKIDDIGIWNRALTQQEITDLYNSNSCPNPPASAITPQSSTTFCTGGFVNLNANTGTGLTYQWYNNSGAIGGATNATYTASQSGNYTVKVMDGVCDSTSIPLTVTVNTPPSGAVNASGATTFCSGNSVTLTAQGTGTYLWSNGATTNAITVNQAGNYSVTVTANGCSATSGITAITVNQTPTASITPAGATTFCAGGFVTLTASGGGTYQWNTGASSPSINATQSNTYSVIVTANGCSATASQVVTANPNPTVTLSPLGNFTNLNASAVTLNGNPAGGTYTGAGVTGSVFTPLTAGLGSSTINYNYTNGFGCSGAASQSTIVYDTLGQVCTSYDTITTYISVSDTLIINALLTGINPPNNHNTVKIYPNPSSDHLYIDNGNYTMMNGYSCTITNALSQQVFYSLINQQQFYIDLSTWSGNGLYFVTIRDAGNTIIEVKKIVIQ